EERVLVDLLDDEAQVVLVEPRRLRDRAADLLAEEVDLAGALARTWGVADTDGLPQLHVGFDRLLAGPGAPVLTVTNVADSPDTPAVQATGWAPVVGDGAGLAADLRRKLADGWTVVVAADGAGSAERLTRVLADQGVAGLDVRVAPLERGVSLPASRLAVVSEADLTGRRRAHRRARARTRDSAGLFQDLAPGDYVVHVTHGVGRYGGMVTRAIGDAERDYLLIEYRGGDKLY